ncbi:MAG: efflux RND transporter permease subunit [Pseudomonadota bacterium]
MNGLLKWMALHPVAANLAMVLVIIGGGFYAINASQTTFPEFELDTVSITVPYQGASPAELTQSIVRPIEDQLASVDGIDEINATAREGSASVSVSFLAGEEISEKIDDVKTEIDRISIFPADAEEPVVVRASSSSRVMEIAVHGNVGRDVLAVTAERLKDELALLDSVSFVETQNIPDREMFVEFDRDTLAAYQLTLSEVASIIGANSLELPGGDLDSSTLSVPIRTVGRNFDSDDFGAIVIRSTPTGAQVLLRDIATIRDDFADDDIKQTYAGEAAVTVNVFRVGEEQVLQVAEAVRTYLSDEFQPSLPVGVSASIWQDESEVLQSRLDLLVKNAFTGLLLVVICLALFLDVRLAFLSAVNITIAFAGTFIAMSVLGTSINMMSLFGFILAIGIVVDNAIVISEKIFTNGEGGMPRKDAAVSGVQRVAVPVIFSAVTTIVAFTPLLQMPSPLGDFLIDIPTIVIMVVTLSLLASLLILPNNLASLNFGADYRSPLAFRPLVWLRRLIDAGLQAFIRGPLDAALQFVTRRFLVPIAGVIAAMILTIGLVAHGYVKFEFFPSIDGEFVIANIDLVDGTSLAQTETVAEHLRVSALDAAEELSDAYNMGGPVVENINIVVGRGAAGGGPFGGAPGNGSSVGNVVVQIIAPEQRVWPTSEFETIWVEKIGGCCGVELIDGHVFPG